MKSTSSTSLGQRSAKPPRPHGSVVDVFCGVGGLSHGFVQQGFNVRAGIDIDASCHYAYERNNGARFVERSVEGLAASDIAIDCLPSIAAGEQDAEDPLHYASRLSPTNLAHIRAAKPGASWADWDPALIAKCHRKRTGRWYGSVYGRMRWDAPAPTITTQWNGFGNWRFGHSEQDRAISLREAALSQTFPRGYELFDPAQRWFISTTARWIGNAVPVVLARAVARTLEGHSGVDRPSLGRLQQSPT